MFTKLRRVLQVFILLLYLISYCFLYKQSELFICNRRCSLSWPKYFCLFWTSLSRPRPTHIPLPCEAYTTIYFDILPEGICRTKLWLQVLQPLMPFVRHCYTFYPILNTLVSLEGTNILKSARRSSRTQHSNPFNSASTGITF